jgi:hypothetical protein
VEAFPSCWPTLQEALGQSPTVPRAAKLPDDVVACLPLTVAPKLGGAVCLLNVPVLLNGEAVPTGCYLLAVQDKLYRNGGWTLVRRITQATKAPWLGPVAAVNLPKRRQGYYVFPLMREPCVSWEFVR